VDFDLKMQFAAGGLFKSCEGKIVGTVDNHAGFPLDGKWSVAGSCP
jgi:hypothetical protein